MEGELEGRRGMEGELGVGKLMVDSRTLLANRTMRGLC